MSDLAPDAYSIPAIADFPRVNPLDSARLAEWYVIQINPQLGQLSDNMIRRMGFNTHRFMYEFQRPRRKPIERAWFAGYSFVEFDIDLDPWQHIIDVPGVTKILGANPCYPIPIPLAKINEFIKACPYKLIKSADAFCAPGTMVRIKAGMWSQFIAPVIWSDRNTVKVFASIFGQHFAEVTLNLADVEVIEDVDTSRAKGK